MERERVPRSRHLQLADHGGAPVADALVGEDALAATGHRGTSVTRATAPPLLTGPFCPTPWRKRHSLAGDLTQL